MFWNHLEFLDVFKTQGKPVYFACFSCARRSVRIMKPRIPKQTSGHLDRSFFLVSRGRIIISTLRCPEVRLAFQLWGCPEVRLGFQLWCVRRSDWFWFVRTSDYRFNLRCPEVGLELCKIIILAAVAVARMFLNASTIRCQRSSVDGSRSTTATTDDVTGSSENVQRSN